MAIRLNSRPQARIRKPTVHRFQTAARLLAARRRLAIVHGMAGDTPSDPTLTMREIIDALRQSPFADADLDLNREWSKERVIDL